MDGIRPTNQKIMQQKMIKAAGTFAAQEIAHEKKQKEDSKTQTKDSVILSKPQKSNEASNKDLARLLAESGMTSEIVEKKKKEEKKKEISTENISLMEKNPEEILADVPENLAKASENFVKNQPSSSLIEFKSVPGTADINHKPENYANIMPIDDKANKPLTVELNNN